MSEQKRSEDARGPRPKSTADSDSQLSSWGRASSKVVRGLEIVGAAALFLIMAFQLSEVFARYAFDSPIAGSADILGFILGVAIFAAIPVVTWRRRHISVLVVAQYFRGRFQYVMRLIILFATFGAFFLISYGIFVRANLGRNYALETEDLGLPVAPLWYVLGTVAALAAILLLERIWRYIRERGDPEGSADEGGLPG